MKLGLLSLLLVLSLIIMPSCSSDIEKLKEEYITVKIDVYNYGTITMRVYPEIAPKTVDRFITLVEEGFYDGLKFHRVIKNFMIQTGSANGLGISDPDMETIKGEFSDNGFKNELKHKRGVVSMARSKLYNSATTQFFICQQDSSHLDGQYAAFGEVIEGMDVVDAIAGVETDFSDNPLTPVEIERIYIVEE
jgi:peptidyl-prolyl cis-trans isomerase B (cyclophilin B)